MQKARLPGRPVGGRTEEVVGVVDRHQPQRRARPGARRRARRRRAARRCRRAAHHRHRAARRRGHAAARPHAHTRTRRGQRACVGGVGRSGGRRGAAMLAGPGGVAVGRRLRVEDAAAAQLAVPCLVELLLLEPLGQLLVPERVVLVALAAPRARLESPLVPLLDPPCGAPPPAAQERREPLAQAALGACARAATRPGAQLQLDPYRVAATSAPSSSGG
jgi:hypothetical protein